jgi:hypothetical protein
MATYILLYSTCLPHVAAAYRVPGLTWREVRCAADVTAVLREGWRARATAATALNAASSRSHAVLCVKVRGARDGQPFTSLLYLVDLAGKLQELHMHKAVYSCAGSCQFDNAHPRMPLCSGRVGVWDVWAS